ncbi:MAG: YdjY domain-containing protein [Luteolibacter sp.]|jgi:hypothetical protein|nr:YdjY domain-containing protein [Luteolibacter sp.]
MHPTRVRFLTILRLATLCGFSVIPAASAQDRAPVEPSSLPAPDQKMEPVKPVIEKIDASRFRVGGVTFDQKTREIRFPTTVNMTEGLLEFIVVHANGKIHESLLITDISPTHLNLAFTLLRYPPSHELYPLPSDTGGASGDFPEVAPEIKAAARITIDVEWKGGDQTRRLPVNDWIQHAVKTTAMPAGPWVYGGSFIYDGQYSPEMSGDIAAIYTAPSALINYPGDDKHDDTVWLPFPKRVPPVGTKVTVIIAPHSTRLPITKP